MLGSPGTSQALVGIKQETRDNQRPGKILSQGLENGAVQPGEVLFASLTALAGISKRPGGTRQITDTNSILKA